MHSESSATLNIDMKDVPEYLKCPISNTFLKEAVSLPCCKQCVNDTIVRQQLLAGGLKCPLCGAANVSTDSVSFVIAPSLPVSLPYPSTLTVLIDLQFHSSLTVNNTDRY